MTVRKPRTQAIETQVAGYAARIHGETLDWDHDGQFSAADKRRILAALRDCDPDDVDATACECVAELGDRAGFDGDGARLAKADKRQIKDALVEVL